MKNKLDVAPGLQGLDGSGAVLAVMEIERAVRHKIYLDPMGSQASTEDWSATSSYATGKPVYIDEARGSASSTAVLPSTLQAEWRPLPPWLLVLEGQLKIFINLQLWRPFCSTMIGSCYGDPRGLVPGVAMVVHGRKHHKHAGDGVVPHLIFVSRSEVLGAKLHDLVLILNFCGVLLVYFNSTALTE
jgi:hypothetical protein